MNGRMVHVEYQGKTFNIPEIWIVGFCSTTPRRDYMDAIRQWAWQSELAERETLSPA